MITRQNFKISWLLIVFRVSSNTSLKGWILYTLLDTNFKGSTHKMLRLQPIPPFIFPVQSLSDTNTSWDWYKIAIKHWTPFPHNSKVFCTIFFTKFNYRQKLRTYCIQQISNRYPTDIQQTSNRYPTYIQQISNRYPTDI